MDKYIHKSYDCLKSNLQNQKILLKHNVLIFFSVFNTTLKKSGNCYVTNLLLLYVRVIFNYNFYCKITIKILKLQFPFFGVYF